ncbi:DUF3095 domain-containing protein [Pedobacter africanus]|uniref:DUF3095 domain-containing protein n=1 Tax=Pedobacter africanus TaxID=151894 RepID=A0A1W1Z7J3_9SPHI|nr:DUF3095 domain-containing protein [Pedobacter africanus]SMC44457.1 Protein of unknown function [Pedobacter africanus]
MSDEQFYDSLPVHRMPVGDLLTRKDLFRQVPSNWYVIITDIKSSTQVVLSGGHQNINLIAAGSIVAVLNIAFGMGISIPFFFGGDGATFIVPPSVMDKAIQALSSYRANISINFGLELRTGTVPVKQIYAEGHELDITRFSSGTSFSIPVVLGNGLNYAERLVKGATSLFAEEPLPEVEPDLSGMQCRWDKIAAPENRDEVITLLVVAREGILQSVPFKKVMDKIDELYGPLQQRQPISVSRLKLKSSFKQIELEMRVQLGKIKWLSLLQTWLLNLYGRVYFLTRDGKMYLKSLVERSDTLVIDGKINTVISGKAVQRMALQLFLDELEAAGELAYGLHLSGASVMSCYVRDLKDDHVHFVDGANGGYTQAARMLKMKLHAG